MVDLTSDLVSIEKSKRINGGLKICSLTLAFFNTVNGLALMIDHHIFDYKSDFFIFGSCFFTVYFATPVAYFFAKHVFGE